MTVESIFPTRTTSHPFKGPVAPFLIDGEVPNGRDEAPDNAPALSHPLAAAEAIRQAFRIILVATGPRDGFHPSIDQMAFHAAIREYLPADKHMDKDPPKSCSVLDLDYKMHAGRVALGLLAQSFGPTRLAGACGTHDSTKERIEALYAHISGLASAHEVNLEEKGSGSQHPS